MPLINTNYKTFTLMEARERVKSVKQYLGNKERVQFLFPEKFTFLSIPGYDPLDEYNFVKSTSITREMLVTHICSNWKALDGEFRNVSVFGYPKLCPQLQSVLCVFGMKFHLFKSTKVTKSAVICLGSRHHAPTVLWREESTRRVIFDKIPAYSDLF